MYPQDADWQPDFFWVEAQRSRNQTKKRASPYLGTMQKSEAGDVDLSRGHREVSRKVTQRINGEAFHGASNLLQQAFVIAVCRTNLHWYSPEATFSSRSIRTPNTRSNISRSRRLTSGKASSRSIIGE